MSNVRLEPFFSLYLPRPGARPGHSPSPPASWPVRPGARPGARAVTPAADGDRRRKREIEAREKTNWKQSSPGAREQVGESRGRPAGDGIGSGERRPRRTGTRMKASVPTSPARFLWWEERGERGEPRRGLRSVRGGPETPYASSTATATHESLGGRRCPDPEISGRNGERGGRGSRWRWSRAS